jgi:hypothetical protein
MLHVAVTHTNSKPLDLTIAPDSSLLNKRWSRLPADTVIAGASCHFIEVADRYYPDYVGFARWHYRKRHFPLYQIVWPNDDGHYPWDSSAPNSTDRVTPMRNCEIYIPPPQTPAS